MNTGNKIKAATTGLTSNEALLAKLKTRVDDSANINPQEQFVKTSKSSSLFKKIGLGVLAATAITGAVAISPGTNTAEAHGCGNRFIVDRGFNNGFGNALSFFGGFVTGQLLTPRTTFIFPEHQVIVAPTMVRVPVYGVTYDCWGNPCQTIVGYRMVPVNNCGF